MEPTEKHKHVWSHIGDGWKECLVCGDIMPAPLEPPDELWGGSGLYNSLRSDDFNNPD